MRLSHILCDCSTWVPLIDGITDCRCGKDFDAQLFDDKGREMLYPILRKWEGRKDREEWKRVSLSSVKKQFLNN